MKGGNQSMTTPTVQPAEMAIQVLTVENMVYAVPMRQHMARGFQLCSKRRPIIGNHATRHFPQDAVAQPSLAERLGADDTIPNVIEHTVVA